MERLLSGRFHTDLAFQPHALTPAMEITPKSTWNLSAVQTAGSKPPLFWVHGDASNNYLPEFLVPDQPIYVFKHQGRHGEPIFYKEVQAIAAHYLRQIQTLQYRQPYFLGGYSFGGTIAFEMAQQLQESGEKVALL